MRLIDADKLETEITKLMPMPERPDFSGIYNDLVQCACVTIVDVITTVHKQSTVNLIYCKDCKHWGTGVAGETEYVKCCEYGKYMVGANGYCVYGEVK